MKEIAFQFKLIQQMLPHGGFTAQRVAIKVPDDITVAELASRLADLPESPVDSNGLYTLQVLIPGQGLETLPEDGPVTDPRLTKAFVKLEPAEIGAPTAALLGMMGASLSPGQQAAVNQLQAIVVDGEDVRDTLFTQLLTDDDYHLETQKYARPFAPGLVQVLVIDTPAMTAYVTDSQLAGFPFDEVEAFRIGQANTDQQSYGHLEDLGVAGIHQALGGESVVTAAKLGNPRELCSDAEISADKGIMFLPLHRSNIFFAPLDGTSEQLDYFQQISGQGWETVKDERGALTKDIYSWAPDGTVTRLRDGAKTSPARSAAKPVSAPPPPQRPTAAKPAPVATPPTASSDAPGSADGNELAEKLVQKWVADHANEVKCFPMAPNFWLLVAGSHIFVIQSVDVPGDRTYAMTEDGRLTYIENEQADISDNPEWLEAESTDALLTFDQLKTLINLLPDGAQMRYVCILTNEGANTFRNKYWYTNNVKIAEPSRFADLLNEWLGELSAADLAPKFTPGQIKAAIREAVNKWGLPASASATSTKTTTSPGGPSPTSSSQPSPQGPTATQAQLVQKYGDDEARKELAKSSADSTVLGDLAGDEDLGVQGYVASNRNTPVDAQERLSHHEHVEVRGRVADRITVANPVTTQIFTRLAGDEAWQVRASVAKNSNAPEQVLRTLADDPWPNVRVTLLSNPKLPTSVQQYLLNTDDEPQIRELARKYQQVPDDEIARRARIEDQYGNKNRRQAIAEQCDNPEILREFARDWSDWVRFAVAGNENTPVDVLQTLLDDDDEEVRTEARDRLDERGVGNADDDSDNNEAISSEFSLKLKVIEGLTNYDPNSDAHTVNLEDIPAGTPISEIAGFLASIPELKFEPAGNYTLRIYDPATGKWGRFNEAAALDADIARGLQQSECVGLLAITTEPTVKKYKFGHQPA